MIENGWTKRIAELEGLLKQAVWWIRVEAKCGGRCWDCASAKRMEDCDLHNDLLRFAEALHEPQAISDEPCVTITDGEHRATVPLSELLDKIVDPAAFMAAVRDAVW